MTQYNIPPWRKVVRLGAVAPLSLIVPVSGDGSFDFTTVTSANLYLRKPDGSELPFVNAPRSNVTPTTITITHVWQAGEVDQKGKWKAFVRLLAPGGSVDTDPQFFDVVDSFTFVQRNTP